MKQSKQFLQKAGVLLLAVFFVASWSSEVIGQQNVFHRGGSSGVWWDDVANPWFYQTWNSSERRPDIWPIGTRNFVNIGTGDNNTMTVNGTTFDLGSLTFEGSAAAKTLNTTTTGRINLDGNLTNEGAVTHTFNVSIDLHTSISFTNTNSNGAMTFQRSLVLGSHTLTFTGSGNINYDATNGTITGTGGIVKSGSGRLDISGRNSTNLNTFTGGAEFRQGIIRIGDNQPLGTGTVLIHWEHTESPLVFASRSGTARTIGNNFELFNNLTIGQASGGTGSITFTGNFNTGNEVGDPRILTVINNHTISGIVSGHRGITKEGAGNLVMTSSNTYTGPTIVNAGTLQIGNDFASSSITINDGGRFRVTGTETNSITIEDGGTLEIASGATLTIREDETLTLKQGGSVDMQGDLIVLGTLIIEDGATLVVPSGRSLIASTIEYNDTGKIEFQRALTAPTFTEEIKGRWVALSSPVSGGSFVGTGGLLENVWTQGFNITGVNTTAGSPNVLEYNGTSFVAPTSNSMTPGKGFLVFLYEKEFGEDGDPIDYNTPLSISGQSNGNSFIFNSLLTHNGTGPNESWNLLGNPLSAGFDWKAVSSGNVSEFAYILNPTSGQYFVTEGGDDNPTIVEDVLATGSSIIAPFQAFWVKTTGESAELSVASGALTTNYPNGGLFKESTPNVAFGLHLDVNGFTSNTGVRFGDGFTESFGPRDAYFLTPLASTHSFLYSVTDDVPTLLKSLPADFEGELVLPVNAGFINDYRSAIGNATLTWTGVENLPSDITVRLYDTITGIQTDLASEDSYSFETTISSLAKSGKEASGPVIQSVGSPRFNVIISRAGTTDLSVRSDLPAAVSLAQNFPNPFNPTTSISYNLPENTQVRLAVYDLLGRELARIVDAPMMAGSHTVTFDASNLTSGVYIYRLEAGGQVMSRRMTLIK